MDASTAISLRASVAARVGIPDGAFSDSDGCPYTARQFIQKIAFGIIQDADQIQIVAADWIRTQESRAEARVSRRKWLSAVAMLDTEGLTRSEISTVLGRSRKWVDNARAQNNRMRKTLKPGQSKEDAAAKIAAAEAKRVRKAERNIQLAKGK